MNLDERFEAKVDRSGECHLWTGCRDGKGYGHFRVAGRVAKAHRVAWEMAHGPIPDGLHVLHRCDVPSCVRAEHLWLGTNAENTADRESKRRGVLPRQFKISPESAARIIQRRAEGESPASIAKDLSVSRRTVWLFATGRRTARGT